MTPEKVLPQLPCSLDSSTPITVGQKLVLKCVVPENTAIPSGAQPEFKNGESDVPYSLVFLGRPQVTGNIISQSITGYKTGHFEFGKVTMELSGQRFQVSPLQFEVKSVLPPAGQGQEQPQPNPIAPPENLPAPWWWWAMWAVILIVVVAFCVKRFLKWKKQRALKILEASSAQRILTPQEKFTQSLQKLESQNWHFKGEYKKFALELTVILKKAIGEKFSFAAEDLTSEEFFETLRKKQPQFMSAAGVPLQSVFESLDQIKFAKVDVTSDKCVGLIDVSKNIGGILYRGTS